MELELEFEITFPLYKARLFDSNLAMNPVSTAKVILVLVDFAEKMEELLDNMRSLFDGLGLEGNLEVPLENVLDISGDIPSLTGWEKEAAPTETSTKPDQPRPFELIKVTEEEEALRESEYESPPQRRVAKAVTTRREIQVDDMVEHLLEEIQVGRDQPSRLETPYQLARIDVVQTRLEE